MTTDPREQAVAELVAALQLLAPWAQEATDPLDALEHLDRARMHIAALSHARKDERLAEGYMR